MSEGRQQPDSSFGIGHTSAVSFPEPSLARLVAGAAVLVTSLAALCGDGVAPVTSRTDPPASPASVPLVFEHVSVIDMTGDRVLTDRTVVVADGRVVELTGSRADYPEGATIVPGGGRYLVPGLIDMHVHVRTGDLAAYNAAGITTVRNMWGWSTLGAIVGRIERGEVTGPRIVSASPGLDGPEVQWPETRVVADPAQAAQAVRDQVTAGWRFIKVYTSLSRDAWSGIMSAAATAGVDVVGHVPLAVPVEDALALGQRSIEHLTGYDRRVSRSGRSGTWGWADADPATYQELASATALAGVWNCPTLAIYVALSRRDSRDDADLIITQRRRFVAELHRAGARIVAGSDAGIGIVDPGTSLHDELSELVAAGLTPYEALRAATVDAGTLLGIPHLGTIVPGAPADLLLLENNPLADLAALRNPDGVVRRGAWSPAGQAVPTPGASR